VAVRPDPSYGQKWWLARVVDPHPSGKKKEIKVKWFELEDEGNKEWHYFETPKVASIPLGSVFYKGVDLKIDPSRGLFVLSTDLSSYDK